MYKHKHRLFVAVWMFTCKYRLDQATFTLCYIEVSYIDIDHIFCRAQGTYNKALNIQQHLYFMVLLLYFDSTGLERSSDFADYRNHETRQSRFEGVIYPPCSDYTQKTFRRNSFIHSFMYLFIYFWT